MSRPDSTPDQSPKRSRAVLFAAGGMGLLMVLLVALLVTRNPAEERQSSSPLIGELAPPLTGEPLLGEAVDVGTNDRWLLVNFFATWCVPCVQEHPQLRQFEQDMAESGKGRVVSVVYGDKAEAVETFFAENGGDWSVLDADDGRTALEWGVSKVPESFLVAPSGVVVARFQGGVVAADIEEFIAQVEQNS
jgi:cytochrome c biogenesis protein CcmG/thiol:disulfide interchange protein DsbE